MILRYAVIMQMVISLVEETDDLSSNVLATSLLVVHDTSRGGEHNVAELTGWKELDDPLLHVGELDVVAWRDDTGLVKAEGGSVLSGGMDRIGR